jgi:hypothetical protein
MTIDPAPLSLEACHQCGLPSITFEDIVESDSPETEDVAFIERTVPASRPEEFLPAANF